jgi:hypothetical protein
MNVSYYSGGPATIYSILPIGILKKFLMSLVHLERTTLAIAKIGWYHVTIIMVGRQALPSMKSP